MTGNIQPDEQEKMLEFIETAEQTNLKQLN